MTAASAEAATRVGPQTPDRAARELGGARPGRLGPARRAPRQRLKLDPFSRSSVRPLALRVRDCSTWKSPLLKRPACVLVPLPVALSSRTVPRFVSRNDPTGIWRSAVSGTNVSPF